MKQSSTLLEGGVDILNIIFVHRKIAYVDRGTQVDAEYSVHLPKFQGKLFDIHKYKGVQIGSGLLNFWKGIITCGIISDLGYCDRYMLSTMKWRLNLICRFPPPVRVMGVLEILHPVQALVLSFERGRNLKVKSLHNMKNNFRYKPRCINCLNLQDCENQC